MAAVFRAEAAQVGSRRAARAQDHIFPSYREHVVTRIRGVDPLDDIIRLMRGLTHGGWDPTDPRTATRTSTQLVLGAQTLHATGLAMGLVFDGKSGTGDPERDEAVIVYYGDGASSQGDVHEAMVFAASFQTPRSSSAEQTVGHLGPGRDASRARRCTSAVRGTASRASRSTENDVLASYAVSKVALDEARAGRWPPRDRSDDVPHGRAHHQRRPHQVPHLRRREGVGRGRAADPIARMRASSRGAALSLQFFDDADAEGAALADDVRVRTNELGSIPRAMFESVYSEAHALIQEEQRWLDDYEASMDGGAK